MPLMSCTCDPCKQYGEKVDFSYYDAATAAMSKVNCEQACGCWEDYYSNNLCGGSCPSTNQQGNCTIIKNAEIDKVCGSYKGGKGFKYTVDVTCFWPPPGSRNSSSSTLNVAYECSEDKTNLENNLIDEYSKVETEKVDPLKYKYKPDGCFSKLESCMEKCNQKNSIAQGCEAQWRLLREDDEEHFTARAKSGNGPCPLEVSDDSPGIHYGDWSVIKDPDWQGPAPGCSPPPPPSPPPPGGGGGGGPPPGPGNCQGGGGSD